MECQVVKGPGVTVGTVLTEGYVPIVTHIISFHLIKHSYDVDELCLEIICHD